ncbi:hypothetical protein Tco_0184041 [Tanacetum coccineum]
MANLKYLDKHNMVAFLKKPDESVGFTVALDFLKGTSLRYALTHNPTVYDSLVKQFWQTATARTLANGTQQIEASIDNKAYTLTEASVKSKLQLADAAGISNLPDAEIYDGLATLGYVSEGRLTFWKKNFAPQWKFLIHHLLHCISPKSGGWDQFGSPITTALICLSSNRILTPLDLVPSTLQPPIPTTDEPLQPSSPPRSPHRQEPAIPQSQGPTPTIVAEEATTTGVGVETEGATTTTSGLDARSVEDSVKLQELMVLVPKLESKIDSLEKELKDTKQTFGNAILTLVDRGRKIQRIDDDPLVSLVREFVTRTKSKVSALGEAQEEDISPTTLETAKTLSRVASLKEKSTNRGRRYKRRKISKGKDINTGLDDEADINTGNEDINTGFEEVNTGSIGVSTGSRPDSTPSTKVSIPSLIRSQIEGKAPMITEETQATKRTKEQIQQEKAGLAEAIRLQTLQEEEIARHVHLDALLSKRMTEEEELTEQQKQRKAQIQFEAQHYTEEDWDVIRANLEANAELTKSVLGKDLPGEDFAKKMVELVNQRKKYFAEERAKAKRSKHMTQSQLRTYMTNYLKNQGTWKLTQLKKLSFEEIKEDFDKLVKQVETFVPIGFEATKAKLKRYGEELQTRTPKKQKIDNKDVQPTEEKVPEVKEDEPIKRMGKKRKHVARKGLHTDKTEKDEAEKDMEASEKDDPASGINIPINPVPVAIKPPSIANFKIIKQGKKGVYQIVRENGTDKVYISFRAMLKDISRDDLTEIYRIVMQIYGINGPEDEYERVFWGYLKTMFDAPLTDIYMLTERSYPLSAEVCKAMLDKKLQGIKKDEDCYKLLKLMEKQAGIR